MSIQHAYNEWAQQYDTNLNKTRDLEAVALRQELGKTSFESVLEIGCGTGKNTVWLKEKATKITSVDLSEEMLAKAREKVKDAHVEFIQANILEEWSFQKQTYDLVSFSLVLEHIENLNEIFKKVSGALNSGGYVYVGELHPFKQYGGSKARFDKEDGSTQVVECYNHHVSDFIQAANKNGLLVMEVNEFFDNDDRTQIPRILTILFKK